MNAYQRHVIHAALQDMENITTHSTGVEPDVNQSAPTKNGVRRIVWDGVRTTPLAALGKRYSFSTSENTKLSQTASRNGFSFGRPVNTILA